MQAAQLETEDERKRRVLRRALENVPNSVRLWKALVDLSPEDAPRCFSLRDECCRNTWDLARVGASRTPENGRKVLNKARERFRGSRRFGSRGEARRGEWKRKDGGQDYVPLAKSLKSHGVTIDRENWTWEAGDREKADPPSITCRAIIKATIGEG